MNYVSAGRVDHEESMNLSLFDLEGEVVIPLDLDPRQNWWYNNAFFELTHPYRDMLQLTK